MKSFLGSTTIALSVPAKNGISRNKPDKDRIEGTTLNAQMKRIQYSTMCLLLFYIRHTLTKFDPMSTGHWKLRIPEKSRRKQQKFERINNNIVVGVVGGMDSITYNTR